MLRGSDESGIVALPVIGVRAVVRPEVNTVSWLVLPLLFALFSHHLFQIRNTIFYSLTSQVDHSNK